MQYKKSSIKPYFILVLATILLYVWQLHLYPMINPDGVIYIQAAAAYLKGGMQSAVAVNAQARWPFYSMLIAGVYSLTGLTMFAAERVLDVTLICVSAGFFLFLVSLFSRHRHAAWWAILIWLTYHSYIKWWPVVVRDHGFVTCLLMSFFCYYRYTLTYRFFWALAWTVSIILAEFFRIEAMLYLLLIPFSIFFVKNITLKQKIVYWLKLNVLTLVAGICIAMLFANKTLTSDSLRFGYMWQEFSLFFSTMSNGFIQRYQIIRHSIFYQENDFAVYVLLFSYMLVFVSYVVSQVSLAAVFPLLFIKDAWRKLDNNMWRQSFPIYLTVTCCIPLFFFVEHVFLNGRYLVPLGIFILLFIASVLPHIVESLCGRKKMLVVGLMSILFAVNLIASLFHFGHANRDEFVMGQWLKERYPNKTIFTNNKGILFHDSSSPDYQNGAVREIWVKGNEDSKALWFRKNDVWCQYDFLVLVVPVERMEQQSKLFIELQNQNAIGSVIKRYKRKFHGEYIVVAPIFSQGCRAMIEADRDRSRSISKRNMLVNT
ncbi:MAG: hypothetical protein KBD83_02610 [Gammaproteobacteria bacterium]|nr:hypothetical protein [Gammaproteobacteria bacterium]